MVVVCAKKIKNGGGIEPKTIRFQELLTYVKI